MTMIGDLIHYSNWQAEVIKIHTYAIKKSEIKPWSQEDLRFLTLALAGEVGELCNFIKKGWCGDGKDSSNEIKNELADIRVYLHLITTLLRIDLDEAVKAKLPEIRRKFPI